MQVQFNSLHAKVNFVVKERNKITQIVTVEYLFLLGRPYQFQVN